MSRPEVLTIPTFKYLVYLVRDQDQMDWVVNKYNAPPRDFIPGHAYASTHNLIGRCVVVVGMRKRRLNPYEAAIAAHEAVHVKQYILDNAGDDKIGIEIEASLVEQVTNFILSH